jgi:Trk K+ transport system NAD-binding subunit
MTERNASDPLHAIIVGCGRVGAGMARRLTQEGYTVTVNRPDHPRVQPARGHLR